MFFWKRKRKEADRPAWAAAQGGFQATRSRRFIESVLSSLERKKTELMLAQKESQSGPTILLGSTGRHLLIDAPAAWRLRGLGLRIRFKDEARLDCYFDTKIVYIKDEIIYAKAPAELYRLQRRAHPRVEVPGGCHALVAGLAGGAAFPVRNLSAGGMLCCSPSRQLACGMVLENIDLILGLGGAQERSRITIPRGRVVRTFVDRLARRICYGVAFECGIGEEKRLMAYVRDLETG
ncbi:MAG: PilZ domain-containing protein [Desulfobacteraceae bacterium]|nr:PilZ domain-containing protein [Desulfobacteraceae bacterium]